MLADEEILEDLKALNKFVNLPSEVCNVVIPDVHLPRSFHMEVSDARAARVWWLTFLTVLVAVWSPVAKLEQSSQLSTILSGQQGFYCCQSFLSSSHITLSHSLSRVEVLCSRRWAQLVSKEVIRQVSPVVVHLNLAFHHLLKWRWLNNQFSPSH